jgi:hypothetical protein
MNLGSRRAAAQSIRCYSQSSAAGSAAAATPSVKPPRIAPTIKKKRWFTPGSILTFLALGSLVGYEIDTHLNAHVLQRNLRTAIAGGMIALDYK